MNQHKQASAPAIGSWRDEVACLPAAQLNELPVPCRFALGRADASDSVSEGAHAPVALIVDTRAAAEPTPAAVSLQAATEDCELGVVDVDGAEWAAMAVAVSADRFTIADLDAFLGRRLQGEQERLTLDATLAGLPTDVAARARPLTVGAMLQRLGLTMIAVEAIDSDDAPLYERPPKAPASNEATPAIAASQARPESAGTGLERAA